MRRNPCDGRKQELCANAGTCGGRWRSLDTCRGFAPNKADACYKCENYFEYMGHERGTCWMPTDDDLVCARLETTWDGGPCMFYEMAAEFA